MSTYEIGEKIKPRKITKKKKPTKKNTKKKWTLWRMFYHCAYGDTYNSLSTMSTSIIWATTVYHVANCRDWPHRANGCL